MTHPIRFVVTDDLKRSRLTVLFRFPLAVPHLVWATLWWYSITLLVPFQWLWALGAGRLEGDVHAFLARYVRYHVHVTAYLLLLANPWPRFNGRPGYPVELAVDPPERQRRVGVLLRFVLAVPALVFASVLGVLLAALTLAGWFVALVLGRLPAGIEELGTYCLRYEAQTSAYLLLLTPRYPALSGSATPGAPTTTAAG